MKTTVEELKSYYVAQGGTEADVANITTIPDMIAAITALGGGGGVGGGMYGINVNVLPADGGTFTAELVGATIEEVLAKAATGAVCVAHVAQVMSNGSIYFYESFFVDYSPAYNSLIGGIYVNNGSKVSQYHSLNIMSNSVAYSQTNLS